MYAPFFIHFVFSTLTLSLLITGILISKRMLRKHISIRCQYNIWFIFLIMLLIPFLPVKFINLGNIYHHLLKLVQNADKSTNLAITNNTYNNNIIYNSNILKDFSVSINQSNFEILNIFLLGLWIVGIAIMVALIVHCNRKINSIKKSVQILEDKESNLLFDECKKKVCINKNFTLGKSALINTPITFGFFRPYIILPSKSIQHLPLKDIKYIFLHELQHFKNKDILINYIMCIFQVLYWFNPLVWYALKEMRADREIACDISVLKKLDESSYIEYGNTIINFVDKISHSSYFTLVSDIGGTKKQIKKRILEIANFRTETKSLKIKSTLIFALIATIVIGNTPTFYVVANGYDKYNFTSNNIVYEDLSQYFKNFDGSFVMYDLKSEQFNIYNKEKSKTRISPDSTYKIYSALFGLEEGAITKSNSSLSWDGTQYIYDSWNQDQDLYSAMKNSTNWYFQDLDKKTGISNLQTYFKQIEYGNYDLSGGMSKYWMESSLKISPIEQVNMLKDFYTNQFKFKAENIQAVKDSLLLSEIKGSLLSGKTGTATINGKDINGWFIGYVEKNENTYFFATNIQNEDSSNGSTALKITLSILNDKKIYATNN